MPGLADFFLTFHKLIKVFFHGKIRKFPYTCPCIKNESSHIKKLDRVYHLIGGDNLKPKLLESVHIVFENMRGSVRGEISDKSLYKINAVLISDLLSDEITASFQNPADLC